MKNNQNLSNDDDILSKDDRRIEQQQLQFVQEEFSETGNSSNHNDSEELDTIQQKMNERRVKLKEAKSESLHRDDDRLIQESSLGSHFLNSPENGISRMVHNVKSLTNHEFFNQ